MMFDPAALQEALAGIPSDAWSLPSTAAGTGVHDGYRRVVLVDNRRWLPAAEPFRFVLEEFEPVNTAWLSWISPGGFIVAHRDAGPWWERWQVPINAAGWFEQNGQRFEPENGKPFQVTHWEMHSVGNPTDSIRLHLVIDRDIRIDRPSQPFYAEGI